MDRAGCERGWGQRRDRLVQLCGERGATRGESGGLIGLSAFRGLAGLSGLKRLGLSRLSGLGGVISGLWQAGAAGACCVLQPKAGEVKAK